MKKLLIIRFSSFGDIFHGMSIPSLVKRQYPECEVHWLVRSDFAEILETNPHIDKVWSFEKQNGLWGLVKFAKNLNNQGYTHIYDCHNNVRSHIVSLFIHAKHFVRRSKDRWRRILLFRFGKNTFPKPFRSAHSFIEPIHSWIKPSSELPVVPLDFEKYTIPLTNNDYVTLAPSAAWEMKRWPTDHWKQLVTLFPDKKFVVLGGPGDEMCQEIAAVSPERIQNMAGQLSWLESAKVVKNSKALVTGDTGMLHVSDHLGIPTIALIGPTAFGFPSYPKSKVLEVDLPCRPCTKDGRGKCSQSVYKKCLVDITPEQVASSLKEVVL